MTKLWICLVTLLLGSRIPGLAIEPISHPTAVVAPASVFGDEQKLLDFANAERRSQGLKDLRSNPMLVQIAREHSRDMCEFDYFDHESARSGAGTPMDRYLKALGRTPSRLMISENIFYSSVTSPELAHKDLMDSEPHKKNILNAQFEEIGVGVYEAPDGEFWVTQVFLTQTG